MSQSVGSSWEDTRAGLAFTPEEEAQIAAIGDSMLTDTNLHLAIGFVPRGVLREEVQANLEEMADLPPMTPERLTELRCAAAMRTRMVGGSVLVECIAEIDRLNRIRGGGA